jgi:hypothetical protein
MATQTEKLREIFSEVLEALRQIWQSSQAHQAQLDRRLAQLPPAIAEGIRPETICGSNQREPAPAIRPVDHP